MCILGHLFPEASASFGEMAVVVTYADGPGCSWVVVVTILVPLFSAVHVLLSRCLFSFLISPIDSPLSLLSTCPTPPPFSFVVHPWLAWPFPPFFPLISLHPSYTRAVTNTRGRVSLPLHVLWTWQSSLHTFMPWLSCEGYTFRVWAWG